MAEHSSPIDSGAHAARDRLQQISARVSANVDRFLGAAADAELPPEDLQALDSARARLNTQTEVINSANASEMGVDEATLRHDMRNTLGALLGYAEMFEEEQAFAEDGPAMHALRSISDDSQALVSLLDGLSQNGAGDCEGQVFQRVFRDAGARPQLQSEAISGVILVADDDASNRSLLAQRLRRDGHQVYEAGDGASTLQQIADIKPDVVLLDLVMPDMSGYDVLQVLGREGQLRSLRVVMISGMSDEASAVRCIDAGAADYLTKPFNSTLLRARVGRMLERVEWDRKERAYTEELQKSRDFVRSVFGRYLSDEVVENLLHQPDGLNLGGKLQKVTILMSDVRGFSQISRGLSPTQLITLINNYLGPMIEVVMSFGGTVDEVIGDSLLALFGAPVSQEDDCDRALACAIAMQKEMPQINARNRAAGLPEIEMGIGVNTGEVVVGNIGSERRSKYGIVGHHVNLTSRVESCTVGGQILISRTSKEACRSPLELQSRGTISFKGARAPLEIFDLQAIGGDFELSLDAPVAEQLQPAATDREIELRLLQSKLSRGDLVDGEVVAFGERSIEVALQQPVALLAEFSLTFESSDDYGNPHVIYARVTDIEQPQQPRLTVTSTPMPLGELLGAAESTDD